MIPKGCKPLPRWTSRSSKCRGTRRGRSPFGTDFACGGRWRQAARCLLALLWPDPCDPLCPAEFKEQARKLLPQVGRCYPGTTDEDLRKRRDSETFKRHSIIAQAAGLKNHSLFAKLGKIVL